MFQSIAPGICSGMVLSLHIEVIYANVGALGNPQPKIIGAAFRYGEGQQIKYQVSMLQVFAFRLCNEALLHPHILKMFLG